jgi:hypothetical protein
MAQAKNPLIEVSSLLSAAWRGGCYDDKLDIGE